jgi:hypothetical protein
LLTNKESLGHIVITEIEVEDILNILDISKSSGPDAVSPRLLKEATQILKSPLCRFFNLSLRTGIFPTNWKCANVTPIFKKDSPSNYTNLTMSFIKIIKHSGLRIDPWGTPASKKPQSDDALLITTLCFLPDR